MLRALIPGELQRRGIIEGNPWKLGRLPYWRDDPHADPQTDYIIPHDLLVFRRWFNGCQYAENATARLKDASALGVSWCPAAFERVTLP
jgi:hypothetical protein